MHVPMRIKQDSEEWGYVLKHKDIIEETEFVYNELSTTIDSKSSAQE